MSQAYPQTVVTIAQPLRQARFAVTAFFVLHGLIFASWIVRIPDIKAALQLTDGQLGLALLAAPIGVVPGQFLVGWSVPRWGSRRIATLMAVAWCAMFPLLGLAPNLPVLMLLLGVYGLLSAGTDVAMNAQASLVEREYGRPIMSAFHGMWSVAGLIGAGIGGFLAGQGVPVALHFMGVSLVALVGFLVAQRGLLVEQQAPAAESHALAWLPRALIPLGLLAFTVLLCEGAVGDWSAVYLRESLGSPPALAAAGYVAFSLLMTVGRLTGDWLNVRIGPARIVRGGGVLVLAGMAIILLTQAPVAVVAGFGLIGAGVACPFPLVISAAGRAPNIPPGRAIAAMATVAYSGSFFGPPLIGSVAELFDLRVALSVLSLVGLVMLLLGGVVQPHESGAARPD